MHCKKLSYLDILAEKKKNLKIVKIKKDFLDK